MRSEPAPHGGYAPPAFEPLEAGPVPARGLGRGPGALALGTRLWVAGPAAAGDAGRQGRQEHTREGALCLRRPAGGA